MGALSRNRVRQWGALAGRLIRKAALAGLAIAALAVVAATVLWDADFYAARQRWESFRAAMFGSWHGGNTLGGIRGGEKTTCYFSTDQAVVLCIQRPSSGAPQKRPNSRPEKRTKPEKYTRPEGNGTPPAYRDWSGRSRKRAIGFPNAAAMDAMPRPAPRIPSLFDQQ